MKTDPIKNSDFNSVPQQSGIQQPAAQKTNRASEARLPSVKETILNALPSDDTRRALKLSVRETALRDHLSVASASDPQAQQRVLNIARNHIQKSGDTSDISNAPVSVIIEKLSSIEGNTSVLLANWLGQIAQHGS